ncbi:MAG: GNAT family N-acetyltransferase [Nocardioidaceae bacterium]
MIRVDDDVELVLADVSRAAEMYALALRNQARLVPWEAWVGDLDLESMRRHYADLMRRYAEGSALPLVAQLSTADAPALVGSFGANIDADSCSASVGYWVDAAFEGQGLAYRCTRAVVRELRDVRGVSEIWLNCAAANQRSRRLAERLGFELATTLTDFYVIGERHLDAVHYVLPSDAQL